MELINPLRPNEERGHNAIISIGINVGILCILLLFGIYTYFFYSSQVELPHMDFEVYEAIEIVFSILYIISLIVSAVLFLKWFMRAYYNASQINRVNHDIVHSGWCWFVPILNLFRPYRILIEIIETFTKNQNQNKQSLLQNAGIYWALWVIGGIFERLSTRIDVLSISIILSIVSSVTIIISGYLLIKIIQKLMELESNMEHVSEIDQIGKIY